jgi:hypothetical protein
MDLEGILSKRIGSRYVSAGLRGQSPAVQEAKTKMGSQKGGPNACTFELSRPDEIEAVIVDLERQIAEQDARIIANLLKGYDVKEAEEKVEKERIVLASIKTSLRGLKGKLPKISGDLTKVAFLLR